MKEVLQFLLTCSAAEALAVRDAAQTRWSELWKEQHNIELEHKAESRAAARRAEVEIERQAQAASRVGRTHDVEIERRSRELDASLKKYRA